MPGRPDDAICLRSYEYAESSQIVSCLTRRGGRVRGLAKGATRTAPSSLARFSGGLWPTQRGQLTVAARASTELAAVTEWDLLDDRHGLRTALDAQRHALALVELVDALTADGDPAPHLFDWLDEALGHLAAPAASAAGRGVAVAFVWRLLDAAGFAPRLDQDLDSGRPLTPAAADRLAFIPAEGGFSTAAEAGPHVWPVSGSTVRLLRRFAETAAAADAQPLSEAVPPDTEPDVVRRAGRLLASFARHLAERDLPAASIAFDLPDVAAGT